jgi:tRNA G37 N-methylase Trm5
MSEPAAASVVQLYRIGDVELSIADASGSMAAQWIAGELRRDAYRTGRIGFASGDVVVDIGAHVGLFSILIAKSHPGVRVIAVEPDPVNFRNLCENVARNNVSNIVTENLAVTGDRRLFAISRPPRNSGVLAATTIRHRAIGTPPCAR